MRGGRTQLQARPALAVAAVGLALVLVAFIFDAAPLFVPGIALFAIGATAPLWVLWSARGAHVRRALGNDRVIEGASLPTTLELRRSFSPDGWGRLEAVDPVSGTSARLGGPGSPLRHSREAKVRILVAFPRRGEHTLALPSLIARDPLQLARATRDGDGAAQTVLVLPRTSPVSWLGMTAGARLSGGVSDGRSEALAATDLEGLRPYRPGTPASRIHWPALARGRGLIERRLQADADHRPLVVVDARSRDRDPAPLDAAVRAAASIVLELARAGGCGLLMSGHARVTVIDPELTAWPAAQAALAVLGTPADPAASRGFQAPVLSSAAGRSGPLIYVTAVCHERLAAALTGSGGRVGVLLVVPEQEVVDGRPRGTSGRVVSALAVSGCRGFALGGLRPGRVGASGVAAGPGVGIS